MDQDLAILRQAYLVEVHFPRDTSGKSDLDDKNHINAIYKVAEQYHFDGWRDLGKEGLEFIFEEASVARNFISDVRGMGFVTDIELLEDSLKKIAI